MRSATTPPASRPCRAPGDESGFVIAQTALLLLPIMLFAAVATDVGGWYLQAQKTQRTADAAALAGVAQLPDQLAMEDAVRQVAARNGVVDSTPGIADDFESGPTPQIRTTATRADIADVEIRTEAQSFFGRIVLDSVEITRFATAQRVRNIRLGNPTSGLGTGFIPEATLGLPNDQMWLSLSAYCDDREQGDPFASGYYGPSLVGCGPTPGSITGGAQAVPTFDPEAYTFVVEVEAGSPTVDLAIYEPGGNCQEPGASPDILFNQPPLLNIEIYGPGDRFDHETYLAQASPIAVIQPGPDACISNSPTGDGWWPLASNLPSPGGEKSFYYVRISTRHPGSIDAFPGLSFWQESGFNSFSLRATRSGSSLLCAYSEQDPTCPQMYALDWLPLFRTGTANESEFYLAELPEVYAGAELTVQFFDAAEGISNIQFVDSNDQAMPFEWRYADTSIGMVGGPPYAETAFAASTSTCSWQGIGGQPCLNTSNRSAWNDHFVEAAIQIPPDYQCGADCWWKVRYVAGTAPRDRSAWATSASGNPIRLIE